jgi:uncharacterized protein DUF4129
VSEEVRGGWMGGLRRSRSVSASDDGTGSDGRPDSEDAFIGRRSVPAAALAAVAESGLLFLPVRLVCVEELGAHAGPLATFPVFVLLFVGAVALATRFHRSVLMPWLALLGAVAAAVAQAGPFSEGGVLSYGVAIALTLGLSLRVVTLALRDWRNPIDNSFGWGAVVLLVEVFAANSTRAGWESVLPLIVPAFFIGSVASRAMSVRIEAEQSGDSTIISSDGSVTSSAIPPARASIFLLTALGLGILVATGLGIRGGVFERVGGVVLPAAVWVIVGASVVLGLIGTVFAILLSRLHIDFVGGLQRLAANLGRGRPRVQGGSPLQLPWVGRLLGLLLFAGVVYVVVRLLNRRRELPHWRARRRLGGTHVRSLQEEAGEQPAGRRRGRRDLPREPVRRWYAEILLLLESRGLRKPVAATPAEYVGIVGEAFPDSRPGFEALTRAYEQVRYAARALDRAALHRLRRDRESAAAVIRKAKRADLPEEHDAAEAEAAAAGGGLGPGPRGALGGVAGPLPGEDSGA